MFCDAVDAEYIYKAGKAQPANYREAMKRMHTDEKNTLFVGDQILHRCGERIKQEFILFW